jgi:hypothetical protein
MKIIVLLAVLLPGMPLCAAARRDYRRQSVVKRVVGVQ